MKPSKIILLLFLLPIALHAQKPCKYPWMMSSEVLVSHDGGKTMHREQSECYFNDLEWMPQEWNILKDFVNRLDSKGDLRREVIVNHWGISYIQEGGMSGDCGTGSWVVKERNAGHILSQPEFRYEKIVTRLGDCGGEALFSFEIYRDEEREKYLVFPHIKDEYERKP
jgi:hypothetical protein